MPHFAIVVATDATNGIGKNGVLPWRLKGDMAHFKKLTTDPPSPDVRNAVIMGRKTWDSIPEKLRPLSGRINVVISRNVTLALPNGVVRADSLEAALTSLDRANGVGHVFIIGGGEIYGEAIDSPHLEAIHVTRVHADLTCDTYFVEIPARFTLVAQSGLRREGTLTYEFRVYRDDSVGSAIDRDVR